MGCTDRAHFLHLPPRARLYPCAMGSSVSCSSMAGRGPGGPGWLASPTRVASREALRWAEVKQRAAGSRATPACTSQCPAETSEWPTRYGRSHRCPTAGEWPTRFGRSHPQPWSARPPANSPPPTHPPSTDPKRAECWGEQARVHYANRVGQHTPEQPCPASMRVDPALTDSGGRCPRSSGCAVPACARAT